MIAVFFLGYMYAREKQGKPLFKSVGANSGPTFNPAVQSATVNKDAV